MTRSLYYRFTANDDHLRLGVGSRTGDAIRIAESDIGTVLYGQYLPLPPGTYRATLKFHSGRPCHGTASMDVCVDHGQLVLGRASICADRLVQDSMAASIDFSAPGALANLEVRVSSGGGFVGDIEAVEISGELAPAFSRVEASDLPSVPIENTVARGRNLYDGYRRGIALQFGGLAQKIVHDPDYGEARRLAGARTILGDVTLCNMFLIFKFYLPNVPHGHIVEFGSYHGGGAIFMAALARKFLPGRKVVGFDTFAGMPPTDSRVDHHQAGAFSGIDLAELRHHVTAVGLDNLDFVQGDFADTAAPTLQRLGAVSFAHIDCDIRSAIECAYDATRRHMVAGGYWILDDPMVSDCLGAAEAMEDLLIRRDGLNSEQVYPHYVFRQP